MPLRLVLSLPIIGLLVLSVRAANPVLVDNCAKCHGGAKQKGGLDLRSLESALKGGESGPALVPGNPEESPLFQAVHEGADPHMPPKDQLSEADIAELKGWISGLPAVGGKTELPDAGSQNATAPPSAEPQLPGGVDPSLAIDLLIQAKWRQAGVNPAGRCNDITFVRRLYLDLLGRIPAREEREAFLADTDSAKRRTLVDRLLKSPEHASHMAEVFDVVFLDREDGKKRKREERQSWHKYLQWAFQNNRSWDKVGRDLLVARPAAKEEGGASWFLYEQREDHQEIATRVSATLFGKQVQCAQCHDHPVSPEIEQRHYWGLVSFFSRSLNVNTPEGPRIAERANGGYAKFSNLQGVSSETELVMLSGTIIKEPDGRRDEDAADLYSVVPPDQWFQKLKKGEKLKKNIETLPVPKFSRREEFTNSAITGNPDFSRAIVNRIWAMIFGRGIVHPVDQMDSAHPPSHPELLDWLARDFTENGYNVRRLIRALVNTGTYQLDSRTADEAKLPPDEAFFAKALDKPLSAEVFLRSIRFAVGRENGADENERAAFVRAFPELFPEVYSPSVQQALFVTNGNLIDRLLSDEATLIQNLKKLEGPEAIVSEAFLSILGRKPDESELARSIEFLATSDSSKIRQLCWALLASAEFRINH